MPARIKSELIYKLNLYIKSLPAISQKERERHYECSFPDDIYDFNFFNFQR